MYNNKSDLVDIVQQLTKPLRGIWTAQVQWNCIGADSATIRIDGADWTTDAVVLATVAEQLLNPGEQLEVGNGFLTVHTKSGTIRCRRAQIRCRRLEAMSGEPQFGLHGLFTRQISE